MEIKARKNTTAKGLEKLGALIWNLSENMDSDIGTISGNTFYAECDIAEQNYVWVENAEWRIKDGEIKLYAWTDEYGYDNGCCVSVTGRVRKINFTAAIDTLENVIKKYNTKAAEKDQQIEKFLNFCAEYKK